MVGSTFAIVLHVHAFVTTIDTVFGADKDGVSFEGSKSGGFVRLNCSFGTRPNANTTEFLVDGSTAFNVRLFEGQCYRTTSGIPCKPEECQCSSDGRRYFWIYRVKYDRFRVECKAKINDNCFASAEILFTKSDNHASNLNPYDCHGVSRSYKEVGSTPVMAISFFLILMTWYTSPLRLLITVCILVSCFQMISCEKSVFFTYKDINGTLCMYCDVKNLHFSVELIDPRGLSYHCTAAIALLAPGDCDQTLPGSPPFKMQQDIRRNRTILTLYNDRLECENGIWQCKHGTNTGEESNVTVSVSRPRVNKPIVGNLDKGVNHKPLRFVLMHCGVFVGVLVTTLCLIKCSRCDTRLMNLRTCLFSKEKSRCDTVVGKVIMTSGGIVLYFILLVILIDVYQDYLGFVASAAFAVIYVVILFWLFNFNKPQLDDTRTELCNSNHSPQIDNPDVEEPEEN